jgi:hypothetical protein
MNEMSVADRPRAEIVERLRLTESLLVVTTERAEAAERKLAEFHVTVEALTGLHKRHSSQLCQRHKPFRSPLCSLCQISARIEELGQLNMVLAQIEQPQGGNG